MIDPTQFESMIDTAYFIATALYGVIGVAGTPELSLTFVPVCSF